MKRSFTNNARYLFIGFLIGVVILVFGIAAIIFGRNKPALGLPTSATAAMMLAGFQQ